MSGIAPYCEPQPGIAITLSEKAVELERLPYKSTHAVRAAPAFPTNGAIPLYLPLVELSERAGGGENKR